MRHVCLYEMAGTQGTVERELTGEHTGSDDASKLPCVVTWRCGMCATYAEEIEHSGLGFENSSAADCADFYRGHGD